MSNGPPPVATSEVTFWRSVFSGSVTNFTLIPYFFVKSPERDCITTMSWLFTVAIVSVVERWAPELALLTATSTERLSAAAMLRLVAKRDKRIFAPFIGWLPGIGCLVPLGTGNERTLVSLTAPIRRGKQDFGRASGRVLWYVSGG